MRNILIVLFVISLTTCSKPDTSASNKVPEHFGNYYEPKWKPEPFDTTLKGVASFYHNMFNGRKTASGDIFSNNKLTAAHKTLPFGTLVRVTSLETKKSVIVVINDRGPFIQGRNIDLSFIAFSSLEDPDKGIILVEIEILENKL